MAIMGHGKLFAQDRGVSGIVEGKRFLIVHVDMQCLQYSYTFYVWHTYGMLKFLVGIPHCNHITLRGQYNGYMILNIMGSG